MSFSLCPRDCSHMAKVFVSCWVYSATLDHGVAIVNIFASKVSVHRVVLVSPQISFAKLFKIAKLIMIAFLTSVANNVKACLGKG